jgi:hypothetical protein
MTKTTTKTRRRIRRKKRKTTTNRTTERQAWVTWLALSRRIYWGTAKRRREIEGGTMGFNVAARPADEGDDDDSDGDMADLPKHQDEGR